MILIISNFELIVDNSFTCFEIVVASLLSWKGYSYELMFMNSWGFSYKPAPSGLISDGINECAGGIWYPLEFYQGVKLITKNLEAKTALDFIKEELRNNRPVIINANTYWCPWHDHYQKLSRSHSIIVLGIDNENGTLDCVDKYTWQSVHGPCKMSFSDFLNGYQNLIIMNNGKPLARIDWRKIIREAVLCMKSQADYDLIYYLKKGNLVERTLLALKLAELKSKKTSCFDEMRLFAQKVDESSLENEKQNGLSIERNSLLVSLMKLTHGRKKFADLLNYLGKAQKVEPLIHGARLMGNSTWQWGDASSHLYNYFQNNDPAEKKRFCEGVKTLAIYEEMIADMLIKLTYK